MAENDRTEEGGKTSVADIAAMLLTGAAPEEEVVDTEEVKDEDQSDDTSDASEEDDADQSPGGGEEDDAETGEVDDSEEEGDEPEDEQSEDEEDDETEYLDISDEDLITVRVDDEEHEVSIGDLKRAYSGEGAIEKRLQEATETRKRTIQETTAVLEKLADDERELNAALEGLDENLFKGVIPPPDERLKQSNPQRYLKHQEAYQQDQQRVNDAKKVLEEARKKAAANRSERLKKYAEQASVIIAEEIPELVSQDKTVRDTAFNKMVQTAMAYGYSEKEIQNALDPRMFMLVRDASKYREIMDKTKTSDPTDLSKQRVKKVRRLKSGNTQAKNRVRQADKQRKAVSEQARKTGKPADVAKTLVQPAPKR